jgi:hypothetical protein
MQAEFETRLSPDVKALVRDTEESIGVEITVVIDPKRASNSPDESGRMGCDVTANGAQILIGNVAYFPDASVFHEVQHVRRILVEGVPRLVVCEEFEPWSPQLSTAMVQLDNNLEHLLIVPRELRAYPERRTYWKGRLQRMISRLAASNMPEYERHRFAMLALLLVDQMLPDEQLKSSVVLVLQDLGITERAVRYREESIAALMSKKELVRVTFDHFGLPSAAGCLQYLDSRAHSTRTVPLASSDP